MFSGCLGPRNLDAWAGPGTRTARNTGEPCLTSAGPLCVPLPWQGRRWAEGACPASDSGEHGPRMLRVVFVYLPSSVPCKPTEEIRLSVFQGTFPLAEETAVCCCNVPAKPPLAFDWTLWDKALCSFTHPMLSSEWAWLVCLSKVHPTQPCCPRLTSAD